MKHGLGRWLKRFHEEERAQSTVEYALVAFFTVAALVGVTDWAFTALTRYYSDTARVVCLPIP